MKGLVHGKMTIQTNNMSWSLFRTEYLKKMDENPSDPGTAISDAYEKAVIVGTSAYGPVLKYNKSGLKSQIDITINTFGATPLGVSLDVGLKAFWAGATTVGGGTCTMPGLTCAFIDQVVKYKSKDLNDFATYLIKSFQIHSLQLVFSIPPSLAPGYVVKPE